MYKNGIKIAFDFAAALTGLLILSPIFVLVLIGLYIANGGKPFFCQIRPGQNERLFKIIKFKTMTDKKDSGGILLGDAERLTKLGKWVRKTSLDEIPQLINVLKGDMSLVGPRPLLPEYLPLYSEAHKRRHLVKPGITGLAQVRGRNLMLFSERLRNDVYYVEHQSFWLDLKILLLTVKSILFHTKTVTHNQTVEDVDDIGLSKNLSSNHFKKE